MKYTSSILLEKLWFPKFVTLKNNLNLYVSSILWVHPEFSNEVYFKHTLNLFLKCIWVSFPGQKYTWCKLSKLTNLHSKLEVYLKYTFWIDAFFSDSEVEVDFLNLCIFKLRSILQRDFLNRCIYFQTWMYTWSRLSMLMYLCSNSKVFRNTFFISPQT